MIADRMKSRLTLTVLTMTVTMFAGAGGALAATAPVKEIVASHFGWEVNKSTGGNVCTVVSKNQCQSGKESAEPGGVRSPLGVAVNNDPSSPQYHDVYLVTGELEPSVQELSASGQFVSRFGWEVNETKDKQTGATQTEKNVCTAASHDVCRPGVAGSAAGQLDASVSVAVDPASGHIYVSEYVFGNGSIGERVQEFTAEGQFVMELGKEVNGTTQGNICTEGEVETKGVTCTGPAPLSYEEGAIVGTSEHDAFAGAEQLTFGGPEDLLYVGEEERVQELEPDGTYKGEVSLKSISTTAGIEVQSIAVDPSGDVYLAYQGILPIYELSPTGEVSGELKPVAREPGAAIEVRSIALDPAGQLAVAESEERGYDGESTPFSMHRGALYDVGAGKLRLITEFSNPVPDVQSSLRLGIHGLAFGDDDDLYATYYSPNASYTETANEVIAYEPVPVAELVSGAAACVPGAESEADATFDCGLKGELDPWGVSDAAAWFQWGTTVAGLENQTAKQSVCQAVCGEALLAISPGVADGLRPNEVVYDRAVGEDANARSPELLTGETVSLKVPSVPPRVVGEPSVPFVRSFSAVMYGRLNPENAQSAYFFEYAPEAKAGETLAERCPDGVRKEACEGVGSTPAQESAEYGKLATTLEASGLQPATTYRYRLSAVNEAGEVAANENGVQPTPEGRFTTAPAPVPVAASGTASAITTTGAVVSGTVNPDGQPAVYTFELDPGDGAGAHEGVVLSASAGSGTVPVLETLALSGLQAGTQYTCRISVSSAYGTSYGALVTFTTEGLPSVLVLPTQLAQLAIPSIAFPVQAKAVTVKETVGKKTKKKKTKKKNKHKAKKSVVAPKKGKTTQAQALGGQEMRGTANAF